MTLFDQALSMMTAPTFRFVVSLTGRPLGAFIECTLPAVELDILEVKEGGLNSYVHQLPGPRKAGRLTLRNGVGVAGPLMLWYLKILDEDFERHDVTVMLLKPPFIPGITWHLSDAYPVKWTGPQLKTDDNTVAIQSLELAYKSIEFIPGAL